MLNQIQVMLEALTETTPDLFPSDMLGTLTRVWGFDSFLGQQEQAVLASLEQRDTLVIFPTGGGKSITYQLPALLQPGTAVVVSPLIALMKDQVDALRGNGVAAAALNSAMGLDERARVVSQLRHRQLKLLYVSPEGLLTDGTIALLKSAHVSFFAVDEAHCISHWGHDFRQEYRALGQLREIFGDVPIHACTATATPAVRDDIVRSLRLRDPVVLVSSFDRPNLTYRFVSRASVRRQVEQVLERHRGDAGIIYCLRRTDVESMCEYIVSRGWDAVPYHAGMTAEARRRNQEAFATERTDVVVATVAFGMGIDRSNVRFVIHTGMPKSVEHYQQEAGRAGRDGLPAECILLYSGQDVGMWRSLMGSGEYPADPVALDKLGEMYRLCRSLTCRHRALLRYFGQDTEHDNGCEACDHCLGENEVLDDSLTVARKILSGVARLRERFGARYVADVLKGARHAKILDNRHDQLSTHGLLSAHTVDTIGDWIDQLIAADFLARNDGEFPTLRLTTAGQALMSNSTGAVTLSVPRQPRRKERDGRQRALDPSLPAPDMALFERLRGVRRQLAHQRGVPPYIIFSDASLIDMARRLPTTDVEFRRVKGVGDTKASDLAGHFLPVVRDWIGDNHQA